jgi:hypothetical protein
MEEYIYKITEGFREMEALFIQRYHEGGYVTRGLLRSCFAKVEALLKISLIYCFENKLKMEIICKFLSSV